MAIHSSLPLLLSKGINSLRTEDDDSPLFLFLCYRPVMVRYCYTAIHLAFSYHYNFSNPNFMWQKCTTGRVTLFPRAEVRQGESKETRTSGGQQQNPKTYQYKTDFTPLSYHKVECKLQRCILWIIWVCHPSATRFFCKPTCRMAKLTYYTSAWYSHLVPQNTGISHHDWIMINMSYGTIQLCNYPVMQPIEVRIFSQFCDIRDLAQNKFSRQTLFSTRIQTFCRKKRARFIKKITGWNPPTFGLFQEWKCACCLLKSLDRDSHTPTALHILLNQVDEFHNFYSSRHLLSITGENTSIENCILY